jgi:hypothetical protein
LGVSLWSASPQEMQHQITSVEVTDAQQLEVFRPGGSRIAFVVEPKNGPQSDFLPNESRKYRGFFQAVRLFATSIFPSLLGYFPNPLNIFCIRNLYSFPLSLFRSSSRSVLAALGLVLCFSALAVDLTLAQVPTLSEPVPYFAGPTKGLVFGQSEGIVGASGNATDYVAGSVNRVLPHPKDPNVIYVGSTNGGVWKTTEGLRDPIWNVTWTPLTDKFGLIPVGALNFEYVAFNTVSSRSYFSRALTFSAIAATPTRATTA